MSFLSGFHTLIGQFLYISFLVLLFQQFDRRYVKKFVQWQAMMAFEKIVVQLVYQSFVLLAWDWYETLALLSCRFTSGESHPVPII